MRKRLVTILLLTAGLLSLVGCHSTPESLYPPIPNHYYAPAH